MENLLKETSESLPKQENVQTPTKYAHFKKKHMNLQRLAMHIL